MEHPDRYVTIAMEMQDFSGKEAGWPDRWAAYPTFELADAAADGIGLVDNDCVYSRIWDRVEDRLVDVMDEEQPDRSAVDLAAIRKRVGAELPSLAPTSAA